MSYRTRKNESFLTRMSRKLNNFVRSLTSRASSSIFSRIDDRIDRVAARKFRFARVRVSVSRTPVAQQHRLTRHTRKVSRYRVSSVSARRAGGRGRRRGRLKRKKKRKNSRKNALECKPDPCEIRGPVTVPPTTTMPDRTFRPIHATRNGAQFLPSQRSI